MGEKVATDFKKMECHTIRVVRQVLVKSYLFGKNTYEIM